MGSALDNLAVQAPLIAVLCGAVSALFYALMKINGDTIADLRKRLDAQDSQKIIAMSEIDQAVKDLGNRVDAKLDRLVDRLAALGERLGERRGGD